MSPIKLYWCAHLVHGRKNFGDWLSPELVRHLSGREVEHAKAGRADMVAVGSVLHRLPTHWWNRRVDVWGTGLMHGDKPVCARHRYHALRGRLTQQQLGMPPVQAFGDPGLLAPLLCPRFAEIPKRFDIGLVPHHTDQSHPAIGDLQEHLPGVRVLNILSEVPDFLAEMAACRFVLSSSLHGLVIADAFQIPNAWLTVGGGLRGGDFKFRDYYSAFGLGANTVTPEQVGREFIDRVSAHHQRPGLVEMQRRLVQAFPFPRAGLAA
jgi:hypothetical protein